MAPPSAITPPPTDTNVNTTSGLTKQSSAYVELWQEKVRGGFAPFPVVFEKAHNHMLTDVDGKEYIDLISQFAVTNFGHSHPKIVQAVVEQVQKLPLVNTAYINPLYARFADRITKKFGFDSITTMLSGSEAVESAIKIARKWAYVKKGIPADEAWVLTTDRCYHGITLATMSLSNVIADNFGEHIPHVGPFSPSTQKLIEYGELDVLRETFEQDGHRIAAFMIEPIQGLSGTRIPPSGYLHAVQSLCHAHNILFICDEVQTGFGRTGTDLAYQSEPGVQPDLVTLGKAVTGGMYPLSVVMGKAHAMDVLDKYEVAGTFAAAPPACAAALAVLDVLEEEGIAERAQRLGEVLTKTIDGLAPPYVVEHRGRGRGLFQTLVLDESVPGVTARRVAALAALRGVLVGNGADRLRFSPPLTIPEEDLVRAVGVVVQAIRDVEGLGEFPGSELLN
ncbi:Ornithine aminotransferase [Lasiodiplodia theobromae]|uniref:Ornithine aminotransferase n=1 Tax=Lasiodiplodia theobromae TaxID=45133 RepID=A0A5N5D888_9PEZI|nr:Ornithine aminotransferase [Lasiodiplodia theobromae]